jgi:hypothetical protein
MIWGNFGDPILPLAGGDAAAASHKTKYCKCNACNEPIIAACTRLKEHWARCKKRPRATIGQVNAGFKPKAKKKYKSSSSSTSSSNYQSLSSSSSFDGQPASSRGASNTLLSQEGAFSPSAGGTVDTSSMQNSLSSSSFFSGGCQHFDFLKPGETEKLKVLFARAIHRTATPYSAFEHPAWKDFFRALRSSYQIPCRTVIG